MAKRYNPPLPIHVNPTFRFRIFGVLQGQQTETTFYYSQPVPGNTVPPLTTMAAALVDQFLPEYLKTIGAGWTGNVVRTDRFDDPSLALIETDISTEVGKVAGLASPSFLSMRLKRLTQYGGQHGRGVARLPGLTEECVTGNKLTGTQGGTLMAFAVACLDPLAVGGPETGDYQQYMATRTLIPDLVPTWQVNAAPITSCIAVDDIGTSRSRMPRRAY